MAQRKSSSKKVVSSSSKNSNKLTERFNSIPLFGKILLLVVLVLGISYGGYYGYRTYDAKQLEAKAGSWTYYANKAQSSIYGGKVAVWACQYRSNTNAPGVKVLAISQNYNRAAGWGPEYELTIGKNYKKHSNGVVGGDVLRRAKGYQYWSGISSVQLSHSQARNFYISIEPNNGGSQAQSFWSLNISDLRGC